MQKRVKGRVSIVVTCYNCGKYIRECLDSLARQTYKHIEIIVVDDASTDNSLQIVKRWKQANRQKVRTIIAALPRNVGYAGAVTTGLFLAKGEYIAMQDGDDISHKDRIRKQVSYLRRHPEIGLVGTNYVAFQTGNFKKQIAVNWLKFGSENIRKSYQKGNHCLTHGSILFRGEHFDKFGGTSRRFKGAEDYEIPAKLASNGIGMENLKDVLYYYRKHSAQRSRKYYG